MSVPVPTLGYRSRSQAAVALREQGLTYIEISRKIGVSLENAYSLAKSGRRVNGAPRRPAAGAAEICVMLGADTIKALMLAAEARNTPIGLLAARLLTCAAKDNIIDAILDDGGKP